MSRTYDRLRELEKRSGKPDNGKSVLGGFHRALVDGLQNLHDETERLPRTVVTLKAAVEELKKEKDELSTQLEEASKRICLLHQVVTVSDQKLQEINQTREQSVKELEREIEGKAKEIENLRTEYLQNVRMLQERVVRRDGEVQDLRDEAKGLRRTIATLEAGVEEIKRLWVRYKQQLSDRG